MPTNGDIGLHHLRVLSIILSERNLTRTAEILDSSQSSISKILARLRLHFDDPLLVRSGPYLEPTPKALALRAPLQELLMLSDDMRGVASLFNPTTSNREFRLLLSDVGMTHFLPILLEAFSKRGPNLHLQALPLDSRQLELKLEAGEIDIAVGDFADASGGLRRQRLYSDTYKSVARADHPHLADLQNIDTFLAAEHIMVTGSNTGHSVHRTMQRELENRLAADRIKLRLPSFVAGVLVVKRTDAIITMPGNFAEFMKRDFGLAVFRTPLSIAPFEIAQLWHERLQNDPGHRWLRETIFSLFRSKRALRRHDSLQG